MLAKVGSAALHGVDAYRVDVEVDLGPGMMVFQTVGLAKGAVLEARTRVKSALTNCGFAFPRRRVTVNLAPAHRQKQGTAFDLPIALGILAAEGRVPMDALADSLVVGELSLDGRLRPIRGVLAVAAAARRLGASRLLVPMDSAAEAAVVQGVEVHGVSHLSEAVAALNGTRELPRVRPRRNRKASASAADLRDVCGQHLARRALEVAAAGGHNLLLIGPPGAGKSMLARRLPSILSPMSFSEQLETSVVASVAGLLDADHPLVSERPFRAPHHTISDVGLVGGGPQARPGEVSLAHNGVLFLDELPEFRRNALEALRQPLEEGRVHLVRAEASAVYPGRFSLVAAMNPCPCGYEGHPRRPCECHPAEARRYRQRISGPLLDRIDLHVPVVPVDPGALASAEPEPSSVVRERVLAAARAARERGGRTGPRCNAELTRADLRVASVAPDAQRLLLEAMDRLALSARAHDRVLRVARTIADLAGEPTVRSEHVAEAVQYRQLDRAG